MGSRYGRVVALLVAVALLATLAVGCAKKTTGGTTTTSKIKTAMVTDIGGLGDKSFNDSAALVTKRSNLGRISGVSQPPCSAIQIGLLK